MSRYVALAALIAVCVSPSRTDACATHGIVDTNLLSTWQDAEIDEDMLTGVLVIETFLIPPATTTTCAAGVGIGSFDDPAPADLAITAMDIVIFDRVTGSRVPLPAFAFQPNAITAMGLENGAGPGGPTGTNPLFDGSIWFGFSATVEPFEPPILGPDETFAFQFTVQLPVSLVPATLLAQYAGGQGYGDGYPIFDGEHPVQYFAPADAAVTFRAPTLVVDIDVKPGSDPNCLNERIRGMIPVAILGSVTFDVTEVDATSLQFAGLQPRVSGNHEPTCSTEDVNMDGVSDLVCQFAYSKEDWAPGNGFASLQGKLYDGTEIQGSDLICLVP
jgi:hypothetical protein